MQYWIFLSVCAAAFGMGCIRLLANYCRNTGPRIWSRAGFNCLALLALVPVALWSVRPYLGDHLVGAGDAYYYTLQLADFVTQVRHGIMPVFVGQSEYAFNGNIHSLRTAPYFTHFAALLDWLTGRRLSWVALLNLTVVITAILAAWTAYATCLRATGRHRLVAWLLAAIYVLSPAIMGPLAFHDMFLTYMTAPWLVVCWYGLAGILTRRNDLQPQWVAAVALALTWYAHSPLAAWLSILWVATQIARTLLAGGNRATWINQAAATLLLALLGAYIFTSLGTSDAKGFWVYGLKRFVYTTDYLQTVLKAQFFPAQAVAGSTGIQAGWSVWLLGTMAGWWLIRRRHPGGILLLALIAFLLLYLIPLPGIYDTLWKILPEQLWVMTEWPEQRLCPLLAAGMIVVAALALRDFTSRSKATHRACCIALSAGVIWSLLEAASIHNRQGQARLSPAVYRNELASDNLVLTRYAYLLFGETPPYFTNGWTDPAFESRLLNRNLELASDNPGTLLAIAGPGEMMPLQPSTTLTLSGPQEYLIEFAFSNPATAGAITLTGPGIQRTYQLPRSGEALAFGSEPSCAKTIPLHISQATPFPLTINSSVPGVSFRIVPFTRDQLAIRLDRLIPYQATVTASEPGFLETSRVAISGYTAVVNGIDTDIRTSPNGLVMVPVPAGRSEVTIRYTGTMALRTSWTLSCILFASLPWLWLVVWRGTAGHTDVTSEPRLWICEFNLLSSIRRHWQRDSRRVVRTTLAAAAALAVAWCAQHLWAEYHAYGPLRIKFELTRRSLTKPEPLVTLGHAGAADCIYIIYDDLHHIRLGLDHWAYGGPISEPISITYGEPHTLEITIGGLSPASRWFGRPSPARADTPNIAPFSLTLDGRTVLEKAFRFYPASSREITIGANPTGGSVTKSSFSGRIISVERLR